MKLKIKWLIIIIIPVYTIIKIILIYRKNKINKYFALFTLIKKVSTFVCNLIAKIIKIDFLAKNVMKNNKILKTIFNNKK